MRTLLGYHAGARFDRIEHLFDHERVFDYGIGMVSEATTIGELLEGCDPDALDLMAPAELARYGEAVLGLWPRLESARLRLVAALDRTQAYRVDGARDMPSWLAWRSGERRSTARRDVDLATAVSAMPAVSDGLADGVLSKSKAAELTRASAATPEQQAALVAAATTASAEDVARRVDRWQLEHSASPPVVDEDLTVTPVPGGARVQATIDTEGAERVQVAVDAAADRLGLRDVAWGRRRARGLVAIARYFLEHADVPATRVGRPTVVVTVDVETLAAATGGAARLDSGAYVSGDAASTPRLRRRCRPHAHRCSMPLDLGHKTRVPRRRSAEP